MNSVYVYVFICYTSLDISAYVPMLPVYFSNSNFLLYPSLPLFSPFFSYSNALNKEG